MANRTCLHCTSSRVLFDGPRQGAVWCFVQRKAVGLKQSCHYFTATEKRPSAVAPSGGWDHVLVKSDPKAHFDPFPLPESRGV